MHRFYLPEFPDVGSAVLTGPEAHHLAHVLRISAGAAVELFDGLGRSAAADVIRVNKRDVVLHIHESHFTHATIPELTLAVAPPKGERFDWLIEKSVELGVRRLIPLITTRSVVDPREGKLDRLRQAVIAACKQCRRNHLMVIETPTRWDEFLEGLDSADPCWIAHPGGTPLAELVSHVETRPIVAAIGPEGGFTENEVAQALQRGVRPASLGDLILRVETAAVAVAALARLGSAAVR
jgi:16S rRNA (uracil1498-N3)-methyltransferase